MGTSIASIPDLNDLRFFAAVVEHSGFSAAGRALGIPKSRLSKRVAALEEGLGVRLLQRTTRRFVVTPVGERFYGHCRAVIEAAQAAQDAVAELSAEPHGVVRVSCPISIAQTVLGPILANFLRTYPKVRLQLLASNRRVDLIGEGFDLAIRVRESVSDDAELVARTIGSERIFLVAAPALLEQHGRPDSPQALAALPALSHLEHERVQTWELRHARTDERAKVEVQARLVCGDFPVLIHAAVNGIGVALLPASVCAAQIESGELEVLLPDWSLPYGILHFVYPSRRGLLPAVRAFIEFLVENLPVCLALRAKAHATD
jgi:DNA-binding transcriptional LysR family regulator